MDNEQTQKLIDIIIDRAGLSALPPAEEAAFRENMEAQINRRIGLILYDCLDEEGAEELAELSKDGVVDPMKLEDLVNRRVPDFENKLKAGLDQMMEEILAAVNKKTN